MSFSPHYFCSNLNLSNGLNLLNRWNNFLIYEGFPCLGVLLQKLENPALRECLKVQSNEVHLSFTCTKAFLDQVVQLLMDIGISIVAVNSFMYGAVVRLYQSASFIF